ncbi:hypothetical protein [Pseudohongiella spirulinae]|uniref:DNA alkylation repair protein n=1 Tax=Pseudohongiella spirulinae TaxID=1249552 RepID=A0A0S2KB04_9GAMM|nr:hypothetical protein [Pseudohongiella spirulinae]ALO45515.1 DNA alkylation repair protein [Pseudohongiella spirulinae]
MAEPLKNLYGPDIPQRIADMISSIHPRFSAQKFLDFVLPDYESLELMPRGWHMADGLKHALPDNYEQAVDILLESLPPPRPPEAERSATADREGNTMAPFLFMPHTFFVARYGLQHHDASMRAQYELTQRFTAEFSIRPFLQYHQQATLKTLQSWIDDPSEHVRRLISEGTRPRLPWASRLPAFQKDPQPVLELLDQLKDDRSLYVRRSVANNLNDIGKDNPEVMLLTARRWLENASPDREWIVRHALRVAIKNAEPTALALMGYGAHPEVAVSNISIRPAQIRTGDEVEFSAIIKSTSDQQQPLLIDYKVHFVKANGGTSEKVFKLTRLDLEAHTEMPIAKKISFKPINTRRHYPGRHHVDLLINGQVFPLGSFVFKGDDAA